MKTTILIKNGNLYNGTGTPPVLADLRINGDRIEAVGDLCGTSADTVIDAAGRAVCPGFVDIHTHMEFNMLDPDHHRYQEPFIRQGITTMVCGNCGISAAPVHPDSQDYLSIYWDCLLPEKGLAFDWTDMGEFLRRVAAARPLLNMGQLAGHGTIRMNTMGYLPGPPRPDQLQSMREQVRQSLASGALGISYGLAYIPGIWADTEELIEVARDLPAFDGRMAVHLRGQSVFIDRAVEEMIRVAETVNAPLQISHFVPFSETYLPQFFKACESIEAARTRGVEIGYDLLTYATSSTTILSLYPSWVFEGGFASFFRRVAEPAIRKRIIDEFRACQPRWPSWDGGIWPDNKYMLSQEGDGGSWGNFRFYGFRSPRYLRYEGWELAAIAEDLGADIFEGLFDLTLGEKGRVYYTSASHDDDETDKKFGLLFALPGMSCMTDSVGAGRGALHPSIYGVFPRFIGRHGRDWQSLPMEKAVQKATSLPAAQMGLADRGVLRKGAYADLLVFDPATIVDKASFAVPFQYPEGIDTVIINGVPVWHDGVFDGDSPAGRVITR